MNYESGELSQIIFFLNEYAIYANFQMVFNYLLQFQLLIIFVMEAAQQQVAVVQQAQSSGGNIFILFIFFVLTVVLHYLVPLIGTIYAKQSIRKWIAYWIGLLILNKVLQPILCFCFGVTGGSFLTLVLGVFILFGCNDEKAGLLVETGDIGVNIATEQWNNLKQTGEGLLRQYGLIE